MCLKSLCSILDISYVYYVEYHSISNGVSEGPSTKRRCYMVVFLKEKSEREQSLRQQERRIKEREIELQAERLALEREERQAAIAAQTAQLSLLLTLLNKMSK